MTALKEIKERAAKAVSGPWRASYWPLPEPTHHVTRVDPDVFSSKSAGPVTAAVVDEDTAKFIAQARMDIPRLVAVAEAAERFIESMGAHHSHIYGRTVPSGFTAESSSAAITLYDRLAELEDGEN